MSYRNGDIRWEISKSLKVVWRIFALALTVSDIKKIKFVTFKR